jgi:hypothetical protein
MYVKHADAVQRLFCESGGPNGSVCSYLSYYERVEAMLMIRSRVKKSSTSQPSSNPASRPLLLQKRQHMLSESTSRKTTRRNRTSSIMASC